jgi:hypothetical protein
MLNRYGKVYAREPGIIVSRATAIDDKKTSFYSIEMWGQVKMYASVGLANIENIEAENL